MNDRLEDEIRDIGEYSFRKSHIYDTLYSGKDEPLYKGCTSFTRLSMVLKLFNLKANHGCIDKSFTKLLELLKQMLDKNLLDRSYEVKKILCPMSLKYIKIHVCCNNDILYKKEYEKLNQCLKYVESRCKVKDNTGDEDDDVSKKPPSSKVLW